MKDPIRPDSEVWDRFIDLIYPIGESLDEEQIDKVLERHGINVDAALVRMNNMVERFEAKRSLADAGKKRATLSEKVREIVAPPLENLRSGIKELVNDLSEKKQLAYFHKLEEAASEEDLQSLMDDIRKLDALDELGNETEKE